MHELWQTDKAREDLRAAEAQETGIAARNARRMLGLLLLGLLNAAFLFYGDILVVYSLLGSLLYMFRDTEPRAPHQPLVEPWRGEQGGGDEPDAHEGECVPRCSEKSRHRCFLANARGKRCP